MVHYGMTKSAQLAVARGMAQQTKGTGVTVNSVLPGPTRAAAIADFLKSVSSNPDASPEEHEAEFFTKHRDRLVDPGAEARGLILPQKIKIEYVLADPTSPASCRRRTRRSPVPGT